MCHLRLHRFTKHKERQNRYRESGCNQQYPMKQSKVLIIHSGHHRILQSHFLICFFTDFINRPNALSFCRFSKQERS